jgi:hypothetical protein
MADVRATPGRAAFLQFLDNGPGGANEKGGKRISRISFDA